MVLQSRIMTKFSSKNEVEAAAGCFLERQQERPHDHVLLLFLGALFNMEVQLKRTVQVKILRREDMSFLENTPNFEWANKSQTDL